MQSKDAAALNPSQRLHLLSGAPYAGKLLGEIESIFVRLEVEIGV